MKVKLTQSPKPEKKYRVTFHDGKHVDFGGKGYEDYTMHKNPERMKRYLARHGKMGENWTINGIKTAGFWSRWLLWSQPTLKKAKQFMTKRFGLVFV